MANNTTLLNGILQLRVTKECWEGVQLFTVGYLSLALKSLSVVQCMLGVCALLASPQYIHKD